LNNDGLALFIKRSYERELSEVAKHYPHFKSIVFDYEKLAAYDPTFAEDFEKDSGAAYIGLQEIVKKLLSEQMTFKLEEEQVNIGFDNPPKHCFVKMKDLSAKLLGKVIVIEAMVNSISEIKHDVEVAAWNCRVCEKKFSTTITDGIIRKPNCPQCKKFMPVEMILKDFFVSDKQFGTIQELLENLEGAINPPMLRYYVVAPNLNKIVPGNQVRFCGLYINTLKKNNALTAKSTFETQFKVLNILQYNQSFENLEVTPEEEAKIKEFGQQEDLEEKLIASFAPRVLGLSEIKFGILCQIFGGCDDTRSKNESRTEIHVLAVGEPGQAKSTLLTFVNKLHPKSVYVSGKGASGVGVTASVEKDQASGVHILKAGAMVLASGGIMMLDEMDKMPQEQRDSMHTAMEQRRLMINKAGINATLTTETSVLAAANPKYGVFKSLDSSTLSEEFNIPATLLSRFDLIFAIKDEVNEKKDRAIANFIGSRFVAERVEDSAKEPIEIPFFRKYIAYAKKNIKPGLSEQAFQLVTKFYVDMRASGKNQNVITTSPRDIEGCIRIAQAIARMHLKTTVTEEEMKKAIALKLFAWRQTSFNVETGTIDQSIVYIGRTTSSLNRERSVLETVKQLCNGKYGVQIDKEDIIAAMREQGMSAQQVLDSLEILHRQTELIRPITGKYGLASQGG
jgi:replicative DNA helicase Mcm